jgi:hypothetical protein
MTKKKTQAKKQVAKKKKATAKKKTAPKKAKEAPKTLGRAARIKQSKAETQARLKKAVAAGLKAKSGNTVDSVVAAIVAEGLLVIKMPSGKVGIKGGKKS